MKSIKNIMTLLFIGCLTLATVSCNKEKDSANLAKVTEYPVFELSGGPFVNLAASAGSFTDPGVVARYASDGVTATVTTTGTVDMSTPGLYQLWYSALDKTNRWTTETDRKILVTSALLTENFAGSYALQPGGSNTAGREKTITISQMVNGKVGWYKMSDSWWQSSAIAPEFLDLSGGAFKVLPGNSNFGPFDHTSCTITYDAGTGLLTFKGGFSSGGNKGTTWTTIWKKI